MSLIFFAKNIEQAKQAEQIIVSGYETTQLDFEEILDVQQMLLNFENEKVKAIAKFCCVNVTFRKFTNI